jgi:hypothetical protein
MELNQSTDLFLLLFQKKKGSLAVLETVSKLLLTIKDSLSNDKRKKKITKAFVFSILKWLISWLLFATQTHW